MKIHKYEVPDELIFRYCKVIKFLEEDFNADANLEQTRSDIHDEIFDHVGCCRSLYRRDDREFSLALNLVVLDLT